MNYELLIDKYYADNHPLKALLLKHSESVASKAVQIVDRHPELGADRDFVHLGAMLHDIGIIKCDAPGILCYGTEPYVCHGMLGAEILRGEKKDIRSDNLEVKSNLLERIARVAERHTGTGLTIETIRKQNLPLPERDYSPETIEEQIICYADKFYSKSHLDREKTIPQVKEMLLRFPDANLERFNFWVERFE